MPTKVSGIWLGDPRDEKYHDLAADFKAGEVSDPTVGGSCATLEDWFDPLRLRDDYVPTGFKGYGIQARAVKGHEFGLSLSAEDKRALIAFLKTL